MDDKTVEEAPATQKPVFEGFRKIGKESKHFYMLPNEWTDISAEIDNLAELKVIEYIMRHTWGFGEYDQFKHITVDEFMHGRIANGERMDKGTGLKSDRSVRDGLKAASDHGYILYKTDDKDKARVKKYYKLKMRPVDTTTQEKDNRLVDTTTQDGSIYQSDSQNLPPDAVVTTGRTQKETSERNSKKNTSESKNGASAQKPNVSTDESSSHPSDHSSFNNSSSQETKPAITMSENGQRILDFAKKDIFKHRTPEINEKLVSECEDLATPIQTQEQFDSLLAYVKDKLKPPYHLKNMIKALNGWGQTQEQEKQKKDNPLTRQKAEQEAQLKSITDEIDGKMRYICESCVYSDFNSCIERVYAMADEFNVGYEELFDCICNTRNYYRSIRPMEAFFIELGKLLKANSKAPALAG